jgi:hypothetical protein
VFWKDGAMSQQSKHLNGFHSQLICSLPTIKGQWSERPWSSLISFNELKWDKHYVWAKALSSLLIEPPLNQVKRWFTSGYSTNSQPLMKVWNSEAPFLSSRPLLLSVLDKVSLKSPIKNQG